MIHPMTYTVSLKQRNPDEHLPLQGTTSHGDGGPNSPQADPGSIL